ncbi:MAG TPA: endolytic transglycosylase MltG [Patescibacteria group bacterium]
MNKRLIILIVSLFVILTASFLWIRGTGAVNPKSTDEKIFVVEKGQGLRAIASNLQNQGLINDQFIFFIRVRLMGLDGKIQAGDYKLSPSMNPDEIAKTMTKGSLDVWVTIPEGKRATEIGEILQNKISTFDVSWTPKLSENEGYLFPDTYLIPHDGTIEQIISIMRNNFDIKYEEASQNPTSHLSKEDAVILASIVEREGKSPEEMKMIASVLENRLNIGMALQADATIQYALGSTIKWWPTPSASNLKLNSPYNSYLNPGLPPTPISNPGLDALTAVFHPADTNYLYYFTDGKGITHYARTLDEQNANIRKFGE